MAFPNKTGTNSSTPKGGTLEERLVGWVGELSTPGFIEAIPMYLQVPVLFPSTAYKSLNVSRGDVRLVLLNDVDGLQLELFRKVEEKIPQKKHICIHELDSYGKLSIERRETVWRR